MHDFDFVDPSGSTLSVNHIWFAGMEALQARLFVVLHPVSL